MSIERELQQCRYFLTKQEYRTLKGQIKVGNIEGAKKGLDKLKEKYAKRTQVLYGS